MKRKSGLAALLSCLSLSWWVAGCQGSYRTIEDGRAGELGENPSCNFPSGFSMESSSETLVSQSDEGRMRRSTRGFWIVDTETTREFLLVVMGCDPSEFGRALISPAGCDSTQDCEKCLGLPPPPGEHHLPTEALAGNAVGDCSCRVAAEPDLSFTLADMAGFLSRSEFGNDRPPAAAASLGIDDLDGCVAGWCRGVCQPKLSGDDAGFTRSGQTVPITGVNVGGPS
mgnify:CR=1 FL=1